MEANNYSRKEKDIIWAVARKIARAIQGSISPVAHLYLNKFGKLYVAHKVTSPRDYLIAKYTTYVAEEYVYEDILYSGWKPVIEDDLLQNCSHKISFKKVSVIPPKQSNDLVSMIRTMNVKRNPPHPGIKGAMAVNTNDIRKTSAEGNKTPARNS